MAKVYLCTTKSFSNNLRTLPICTEHIAVKKTNHEFKSITTLHETDKPCYFCSIRSKIKGI